MLYKVTQTESYLSTAETLYSQFGFDSGNTPWAFDWTNKLMGAKVTDLRYTVWISASILKRILE